MEFHHLPVLLGECLDGLAIRPNGTYLDCTLGGAGHSSEIFKRLDGGLLIGIDRDADAIEAASARMAALNGNAQFMALPFGANGCAERQCAVHGAARQFSRCESAAGRRGR